MSGTTVTPSNTTALSVQQFVLILAQNPAFLPLLYPPVSAAISSSLAAATNAVLTGGYISASGSLTLTTAGGAVVPIAGTILGGTQGLPGPQGNTVVLGNIVALWNPATNTPPVASGGLLNGTLAASGSVVLVGGTIGATTTLSTAVDGILAVTYNDQLVSANGTWSYVSLQGNGTFGVLTAGTTIHGNNGDGKPLTKLIGGDGGVATILSHSAGTASQMISLNVRDTLSAGNIIGPPPTFSDAAGNPLSGASSITGLVTQPGMVLETGSSGHFRVINGKDRQIVLDQDPVTGDLHVVGNVISKSGTLTASSGSTTFTAQDIANFDAQNLAASAAIKNRSNTTAMRATAQYNLTLAIGQSKAAGTDGNPPISTTQPLDNLMWTGAVIPLPKNPSDPTYGTLTTVTDTNFHPLVANSLTVAGITSVRTGALTGLNNVGITVDGSNNATITCSGANFSSIFAAGDTFQFLGFTVATGNNASIANNNVYQVASSATGTLITSGAAGPSPATAYPTTAPESGITIAQAAYAGFGQNTVVTMLNDMRKYELNQRGLLSDPTRLRVGYAPALAVPVVMQSPTNSGFTPSPYYWNRITAALTGIASAAASGGGGYAAGSACLNAVYVAAGGDEAGAGANSAQFAAQLSFWLTQVTAAAYTAFGASQTAPPFVYAFCVGGTELNDGGAPPNWAVSTAYKQANYRIANGNCYICSVAGTSASSGTGPSGTGTGIVDGTCQWNFEGTAAAANDPCPIPMGIHKVFGTAPSAGFTQSSATNPYYSPNYYLVGPDYQVPDTGGGHSQTNGYAWWGAMVAKVRIKIEILGQGWLPCLVRGVYLRGAQILVCCHVPEPPLQILKPIQNNQPYTFADLGFLASDVNGPLTITPVGTGLPGQTLVWFNANRTIDVASFLLQPGSSAVHNGMTMIGDSDPWQPQGSYVFTLGAGFMLGANVPNAAAIGTTVQNGVPYPMQNWLCPGAYRGIAA